MSAKPMQAPAPTPAPQKRGGGRHPFRESRLFACLSRAFAFDAAHIAVLTAALLVCWLPLIVMMQPTSFGADTVAQLLWSRGYAAFDPSSGETLPGYTASDHHPYLATLVYSFFDWIGHTLLGNDALGFMLYGVCQAVLTAASLVALTCYCVCRLEAPKAMGWTALGFYAIVPVFAMNSQVIVKDLTSMPFFICWTGCYLAMLKQARGSGKVSAKVLVCLVAFGLVGALLRKTLVYIELLALLVALFAVKGSRTRVLESMAVLALVAMVVVPKLVLPVLNVAPSGSQEMLAIPAQQTAKVLVSRWNQISQDDLQTIARVIDIDTAKENYSDASADNVKDKAIKRNSSLQDKLAYLVVWVKQGFTYPTLYLRAVGFQRPLYLYTADSGDQTVGEMPTVRWGWDTKGGNDILPNYNGWNGNAYPQTEGQRLAGVYLGDIWGRSPVLTVLVRYPTYTLVLPLVALALCLRKKSWRAFVALIPLFASLCIILIAPACQGRYVYNCLYLAPLFICIPLSCLAPPFPPRRSRKTPKETPSR